jgi:hypothetical protein
MQTGPRVRSRSANRGLESATFRVLCLRKMIIMPAREVRVTTPVCVAEPSIRGFATAAQTIKPPGKLSPEVITEPTTPLGRTRKTRRPHLPAWFSAPAATSPTRPDSQPHSGGALGFRTTTSEAARPGHFHFPRPHCRAITDPELQPARGSAHPWL